MPISFSCGQCGKHYLVGDALAGKRAMCKACQFRMVIPGALPAATTASPAPREQARSVTRPATSTRPARVSSTEKVATKAAPPRPLAQPRPTGDDPYGLNEAPSALPPLMPPRELAISTEPEPLVKPRKKKKSGFFSSGGSKSGSRRGFFDGVPAMFAFRIGFGIIFAVVTAVMGYGLRPKSEVTSFHQRLYELDNEMLEIFRSVTDLRTAQAASPRLQDVFRRIIKHTEENGFKKASVKDIEEVSRQYSARFAANKQEGFNQMQRIIRIPGAKQALKIDDLMTQLMALDARLKRENGGINLN